MSEAAMQQPRQGGGGRLAARFRALGYHAYIAGGLARTALLVTVSLTSIVWLTQALRLLDFIINQGVSVRIFLLLTVLLLPSLIMLVLPIAVFCALLFHYQKLKSDSELIAMQAGGLSKWRLAVPGVSVAVGAVVAGYVISLYVLPLSYGRFKEMQSFLRNQYVSILLQEGVFASPVEGLTVFIRERAENGNMKGVLVHDGRDAQASVTMMADEARLIETARGPRFLLEHGNRQEMRDGKLSFLNFDSYALDIDLYTQGMSARSADPQERFIPDLFSAVGATSKETLRLRAEGHQRLLWPMYSLSLALMALALILSGEFNRRARWQRNAAATGLATLMLMLAVALRNLMAGHAMFVPLAYANLLIPALLAGFSLAEMPLLGGATFYRRRKAA